MSFPGRFRVWNSYQQEWVKDDCIFQLDSTTGKIIDADLERHIISWSTGLFDKRGREIFEGDVITRPGYLGYISIVEWVDINHSFEGILFHFDPELSGISDGINESLLKSEHHQILGNIYERKFADPQVAAAVEKWRKERG